MPRFFTALLVVFAFAAATVVSWHATLRVLTGWAFVSALSDESVDIPLVSTGDTAPPISLAESCFPLNGQAAQRARLEELLEAPTAPPQETDVLGLARYAEYALRLDWSDEEYEQIMREGMRRDPGNALYHYLLAYRWIKLSLEGEHRAKDAPAGAYTYRVQDRALLDQAMRELAVGLSLPLDSRRYDLISARLDAMPRARYFEERMRETSMLASVLFPEYAKLREFTFVNGYYLSLLLAEGKRADAEPFLHTGERLIVQIAEDRVPTLIGMLVAIALSKICQENDPVVCRAFGYQAEAEEIERRLKMVTGGAQAWKESRRDEAKQNQFDVMVKANGGLLASILLPIFGNQPWITPRELRPSRAVEFVFFGGIVISLLPAIFLGLMALSALKYARWRLALGREAVPSHDSRLSGAEWARVLLQGVLLPLALFAGYSVIPSVSFLSGEIVIALLLFCVTATFVVLWLLMVPATIAANAVWRRHRRAGIIEVRRPRLGLVLRGLSSLFSLGWAFFLVGSLLPPAMVLGQALLPADARLSVLDVPFTATPLVGRLVLGIVLVGVALLPAVWERHHRECAQHFLALARGMVPVYAVLALCTAALYPALLGLERHFLRQDRVMSTMHTSEVIAFTRAEGRLVLGLRNMMLDGARQLDAE